MIATGVEWPAGLALLRGIRAAGFPVIAAASRPNSLARWSRVPAERPLVPDPQDAAAHAGAVAALAERHPGSIVLPGSEGSLLALAEHRDRFGPGVTLAIPPLDVVRAALDKRALSGLAAAAGLQVPPTVERTADDLGDVPLPAVVKPFSSQAGGDERRRIEVCVVHDRGALRAALAALPGGRGLVQPYVDGHLRTVNGVAWEGTVVCSVHKRGVRTYPPGSGVLSYGMTIDVDPGLDARCARLIGAVGWSGLFNLQFLEPERGEPLLIDLNPRAYHSMELARRAGADLPAIWLDLLTGRSPRPARARAGVRFRAEEDDLRTLKAMGANGQAGAALRGLLPRRGTAHALFAKSDPGPLVYGMARLVSGRLSRGT